MISQKDIERTLVALKPTLSARFNVDKIGYFGSIARNEHNDNSDIDIIVSFYKPLGWAFFDLQELLEKELNRRVDLVSINAIKEQLKDIILNEVKYI
jgi:predicted nucleotidyltransferase